MINKQTVFEKIIRPVGRTIKRVFPPADIWRINYLAHKHGNVIRKYKPCSFEDHCKLSGDRITIVENTKERIVYDPPYYPEKEGREYTFLSPSIYVAGLKDIIVHGGSGLIITGNHVLSDICSNDDSNRINIVSGSVKRANNKVVYLEETKDTDRLKRAVSLCGMAAGNYFHLTVEILSRFEYVKKWATEENYPVLLDEDAGKFPQFKELVKTILGDVEVIYVPKYKRVFCEELIYPSMNTWMPMNVRKKKDFRLSDNLVALSAIENIRKTTRNQRKENAGIKVFISRRNISVSRLVNEDEIASLFEQEGFRIVCTEELSYIEQVELFSSASCIVGTSGAAMTNFVYCNKEAVIGCILPKKNAFCVYSSIAHMIGCKVLFIDAKVVGGGTAASTEKFRVDVDDCRGYIKKLESL